MFTFYVNKLPLSVYNFGDYYFDYYEVKKFTSNNKLKSREAKMISIRMSLSCEQERYMTIDQTLVYLNCFADTDVVSEFILTDIYDVLYNYNKSKIFLNYY
ncbi:hypothetical protein [Apocheima cinerarium nucleopolyhedrovirus]|uniref:hypothetical protein n=1 Tax=Apocheima cinerarium nucleopolyhedrovirus TaxID=307461 RepID=UPI0001D920C5|nr:hypothetical protein [Apocheima cinerarium nucleopolyhedrovirus]ADB84458.1 hypothetical protein [Apocheima cinerarium nucleopolyhedrovirus]